ncbi:3-isopropylmalate dehydratase small subunit [Synechococcus sp. CS-1325]|uniref:3-isopropylmalate dehydratase small subunit n=1 Tax=unclassified Synechococcus TaxID=2626047 RepID=UPI000DB62BE0|nr:MULTISPECIES: 3-isopropylmalate dehydratase small subunit [unclassified Synechococcus]PZV01305.1 MAG: isopropylmalate isomerase [Cyanobium sp.]MCT0200188.1 3-isopropylmalate dehydratase small subunit [Synechococcus sp. CS-1325]MCT0212729.1 3-isopropylmalate dehydratase small subunit [Synechococcus sp. CS-1326]MCT0230238.1 3-isopropylmalate dehydratase small subunit [Synechococcus sp. CS-1324]MCT0233737.1 3-isopropylmalate dehydratase small subunit [Synechococcus sp. CS-1327]
MTSPSFPFGPVRSVAGTAVALNGDDIDTDRIIPARFLKCVTFEGLGEQVFADDRSERAGAHPLDRPEHRGARILLVNRNFGCGSSREHAPQALMRWGIRAVVGESFAEIFFGNCLALGIPCLQGSHDQIRALQALVEAQPATVFRLEVDTAGLHSDGGAAWPLELGPGPSQMLRSGQWDATGQLVAHDQELRDTAERLPYLNGFASA